MNDQDKQRLSRYLDGELSAPAAADVRKRIEADTAWREEYDMLKDLDELSRETFPKTEFRKPQLKTKPRRRWRYAAAAALVLFAGGLTWAAVDYLRRVDEVAGPVEEEAPAVASALEVETPEAGIEDAIVGIEIEERPGTASAYEPTPITGLVLDVDGTPVAGAKVLALAQGEGPDVRVLATARTDSEGLFAMAYPVGAQLLGIHADGYMVSGMGFEPPFENVDYALRARLFKAKEVHGRVVDGSGRPLAGVRVQSVFEDFREFPGAATVTDKLGMWKLHAPAQEDYYIRFDHDGYATSVLQWWNQWRKLEHEDDVTITMVPGGTLRVRVLREGKPAANVRVLGDVRAGGDYPANVRRTDREGYAVFANLPVPAAYSLTATTDDGGRVELPDPGILITKPQTYDCVLEIPSYPARLHGRLLDADGRPVAQALAGAYNNDDWKATVKTGMDGRFETVLPKGVSSLHFELKGQYSYAPAELEEPELARLDIDGSEDVIERTFQLARKDNNQREFILLGEDGETVSQAVVAGLGIWSNFPLTMEVTASSPYLIQPQDTRGQLSVLDRRRNCAGYGLHTRRTPPDQLPAEGEAMEVSVDIPVCELTGRVIDPKGRPMARTLVRLIAAFDKHHALRMLRYQITQTDDEGNFVFEAVLAGLPYRLTCVEPGYALSPIVGNGRVVPSPGATPATVVFAPEEPREAVSGRVVYADATPVVKARVAALVEGEEYDWEMTDFSGSFTLSLEPGTYQIACTVEGEDIGFIEGVATPAKGLLFEAPLPLDDEAMREEQLRLQVERYDVSNNFKQAGIIFKMFSNEAKGELFPALEPIYGALQPEFLKIYPEYLADIRIVDWTFDHVPAMSEIRSPRDAKMGRTCYLGYLVDNEATGKAFLDAYEQLGPEALYEADLQVEQGQGSHGADTIYRLRDGIEKEFETSQSEIPILWEIPGTRENSTACVLYMDGHVEFKPYPGEFPLTETFINRIKQIMELDEPDDTPQD